MSHRVTTKTEIKDKGLAINALKAAGFGYEDLGSSLRITSGPARNATLDLKTGEILGDTDYSHQNNDDSLGILKRYYAEAKYRQECQIQGYTIESREEMKDGRIVLTCYGNV